MLKLPADFFEPIGTERQQALRGIRLAPFRQRALAIALDGLLIIAIVAAFDAVDIADRSISLSFGGPVELEGAFGVVVSTAYFTLATYLGNGRTIGKYISGIRVVSLVNERISFWHCLDRALGYALSSVVAGLGFVQYFTRPNHQTIHDRLAHTVVVCAPRNGNRAT